MITRREYLKALDIVEAYHKQLNYNTKELEKELQKQLQLGFYDDLRRNDYIIYVSGSTSQFLTKGKKYQLLRDPDIRHPKILIKNDNNKRMVANKMFFKEAKGV